MRGIFWRDGVEGMFDGFDKGIEGASFGSAQSGLDFRPTLFDWVKG
jgi:hypothetical protein